MIKVMVVVSNQGTVHYLRREQSFDYSTAVRLFKECIEILGKNRPTIEMYLASLTFLAKCSEVGLYYR